MSVEINVTEMGTCARVRATRCLHSSCPVVRLIGDHLQLDSSPLDPSQLRQVEPVLLTFFVGTMRGYSNQPPPTQCKKLIKKQLW